jgi:pimeloyl-ACP methyl ester carboxylesterase
MPSPLLLLVPGLGLGPEAWAPTRRALAGGAPTCVKPLPGYGVPAARARDLSPAALAEDVLEGLPEGSGPVVLVGHSASCQVVVHAALAAPTRISGLVLVGPTTDPRAATWPRIARRWLRTARHEDPRQVPLLVRLYLRTGLGTMARAMEAARKDRIDEALGRIGCPVLVLRGRHDRICSTDWADAVARAAPHGTTRSLPSGAHMVPITHGRLVAPVIDDFLQHIRVAEPRDPDGGVNSAPTG